MRLIWRGDSRLDIGCSLPCVSPPRADYMITRREKEVFEVRFERTLLDRTFRTLADAKSGAQRHYNIHLANNTGGPRCR